MVRSGYNYYMTGFGQCGLGHIVIIDADQMKFRLTSHRGGNGLGLATENVCYTLTARDIHMVGTFYDRQDEKI